MIMGGGVINLMSSWTVITNNPMTSFIFYCVETKTDTDLDRF